MRLLRMKKKATDRFMRDAIGCCHGAQRFLLLHHTMQHRRPLGSGKAVCRVLWSWTPMRGSPQEESFPQLFPPQKEGAEPFDTVFLSVQGRGRKLVTEDSKPVGSGESICRI